jgi:hypothetical protein
MLNLTKDVKDLYNEALKKETVEDTRRWKDSHIHELPE